MTRQERGMTLLTPEQVCERTQLCKATIYQACKDGTLRATKLGNRWRIHPESVEEWLKAGEPEPGVALPEAPRRSRVASNGFRMLIGGKAS